MALGMVLEAPEPPTIRDIRRHINRQANPSQTHRTNTTLIRIAHSKIVTPASRSRNIKMVPQENANHGSPTIKKATGDR